jgi:hypothetical protein
MNSGFYPKVLDPTGFRAQTQSQQPPFFFGGSQVPHDLGILSRHHTVSTTTGHTPKKRKEKKHKKK